MGVFFRLANATYNFYIASYKQHLAPFVQSSWNEKAKWQKTLIQ